MGNPLPLLTKPLPSAHTWRRRCLILLGLVILLPAAMVAYLAARFLPDTPVAYANSEDHFKYGSTGGEHESGFPYWIFQALPQVCAQYLPGQGYQSLGLIFEEGKDLPVGMSKRRYQGIDRTFLNCAVCHTSTVRATPDAKPRIITGMPANTFDIMAFERFFFDCGADPKFSGEYIVPEARRLAQARGEDLDLIDRYLVYPLAVWLMRERLLMLRGRFSFVQAAGATEWGPGRVDTFNSAKVLFNFPMHRLPAQEMNGPADFPSVWNQSKKRGMQLHWDGNNDKVEERNNNAAFGTGVTPATVDRAAIKKIESWLWDQAKPPEFPYPIDRGLAAKGAGIYQEYCADCHGASGQDFSGKQVGKVTPIEQIGTDRRRLDSFSYELAVNLATPYADDEEWRFKHFRKTFGYANMPLDGLWLRAPYLHNGSVPTLRDLLEPVASRAKTFYRGYDVYDPVNVGFLSNLPAEKGRKYFKYDTAVDGNSNKGHEGPAYGTELPAAEKTALLEYLKTF